MMKYRKRAVIIEAFKFRVDCVPDWFQDKVSTNEIITYGEDEQSYCIINTLEGQMRGSYGDYIIKGVKGEIYPCKPDIFELTYEPASGDRTIEIKAEDADVTLYQLLLFCKDKAVRIRVSEGYLFVDEVNS